MSPFIASMVENATKVSVESGKAKYKAYFVNTTLYLNWKLDVDAILTVDGYSEVIV